MGLFVVTLQNLRVRNEPTFDGRPTGPLGLVERPLKICQVVPYDLSEKGGVKHHAFQLARVLRERGDDVTIIGPSSRKLRDLGVVVFPGVANFPSNGSDNRVGLFVSPWRVGAFMREQQFDVVHVHEPLIPALPLYAIWGSPESGHVATFHSYSERSRKIMEPLGRLAARFQHRSYHMGVAVSAAAASFANRIWPGQLTVVPNGVQTELFTPLGQPRPPGPPRILFVGRLGDRRKGFAYALEAFRRLRARGLEVVMEIAGELGSAAPPPDEPGLNYYGAVGLSQLTNLFRTCDIFLAPSTGQESFGIVLLEAMASGRPIVCSDIAGYRQTVGTDGSLLVPPEDPAAIAQAVEQLVVHPGMRDRMGESNYRRAAQFSWKRVTNSIRNVYLEAMCRRARLVVERELCREESATASVLGSPLILPTARD